MWTRKGHEDTAKITASRNLTNRCATSVVLIAKNIQADMIKVNEASSRDSAYRTDNSVPLSRHSIVKDFNGVRNPS